MKADLDRLMAERDLAAIAVVAGEHGYSAPIDYLVGGVHITGGTIIKKRDEQPVLVVSGMEVEEARATGYQVYTPYDFGFADLMQAVENDLKQAQVLLWGNILAGLGIPAGRVGLYGSGDINIYIELVRRLETALPQYQFVGEMSPTIFDQAYVTKDTEEFARIRSVAERTSAVVRATWDYIASHRADETETVVKPDGTPLTIGDVKKFVINELMLNDLEDIQMIFAQGRDAGYPHSRGNARQPLKLGQSIVFDLFPRESGGGYHHDMTRTWCIGYAPDEVREVYDQVMEAFDMAVETFGVGKPTHLAQEAVLNYFEGRGHQTSRSHPGTQQGYVHSLGHGLGLNIHENPRMSHLSQEDIFQVGNVVTIEPGLYYPERGYGVRIEDTFYVAEDGQLISLTDVPRSLILPLRG